MTEEEPKKGLVVRIGEKEVETLVIPSFEVAEDLFQIFTSCLNMYRGWQSIVNKELQLPINKLQVE